MTLGERPARSPVVLGVDLGTSSVKVVAVEAETGRGLGDSSSSYPLALRDGGVAEQDTRDWWAATATAVRAVVTGERLADRPIAGIGLSGQMHGLVLSDAAGRALAPVQTWADVRADAEAAEIAEGLGGRRAVALAGSAPDPGFMAAKLLWMRRHRADLLERARWTLLPKDWLRLAMTGDAAAEPSDASGTGLLDVSARAWSDELCRAAEADIETLPRVAASAEPCGAVNAATAEAFGLPAGTPIVAGAGDAPAAGLAAGVAPDGRNALASLGSAGQIYVRLSRPIVEPDGRLHTLCHPAPHAWSLMAAILSAGAALQWLADALLGPGRSPAPLLRDAAGVPPGADGLLFAPWLRGERSVHLDADVRGAFVGLGLHHGRGHLARAVLEGVAFALRTGMDAMAGLGVRPGELVVAGGGARSALWRRVLADALGVPVARLPSDDASALGAARLAADGCGFESRRWRAGLRDRVDPDPAAHDQYESAYAGYSHLYGVVRDL